MGQELAVTPLQLIAAHAVLANGGQLMRPHLVLRHTDAILPEGQSAPPVRSGSSLVSSVIDGDIANWLVQGPMVDVVKQGTGKKARLEDYTVFGKTGTAQKLDPDTGAYAKDRDVCSFLCGAPAANPQVLVLIVVDEPKGEDLGGGTVAAPHAAELLRQSLIHLRIGSDLARKP
jgi:cell division protein FtsI/penicillin-binding protein 2